MIYIINSFICVVFLKTFTLKFKLPLGVNITGFTRLSPEIKRLTSTLESLNQSNLHFPGFAKSVESCLRHIGY